MAKLYEAFSVYEGFVTVAATDADYYAAIQTYDKMTEKSEKIGSNITTINDLNTRVAAFTETEDSLKYDMEFMVAQQKNTSMIGMITIATLLVGTFLLVGRYS